MTAPARARTVAVSCMAAVVVLWGLLSGSACVGVGDDRTMGNGDREGIETTYTLSYSGSREVSRDQTYSVTFTHLPWPILVYVRFGWQSE